MENKKIDIAKVEAQIAKYEAIILKDPNKSQAYDLKARELMKINRLEEALECYNEVLKLQSENKIYLAQRAKLYGLTDQSDKALEDLNLISQLQQGGQDDDFSNLILSNTLQDVQKLDSVNKKIAELRNDKNINPGLLDAIQSLCSVTGTLTVKVGIHKERLSDHDAIKELQTQQQKTMELMERIQSSNAEELKKMQAEIQNQRFNALFAETKYRALELRVQDLEDFKKKFPDSFLKFEGKEKEFEDFLQKYDSKVQSALKDYIEGFISQCSVAYTTALVVKSGQFKLETSNTYIDLGSKLLSFIPYIGEITSSAIDFLSEKIETTKIEAKADNILKYCSSACSFEQNMKYVVISRLMDENKKGLIVDSAQEEGKLWYEKIQALYEKIELAIKDKIQENTALQSTTAQYKLGLRDASDLLDIFILSGKVLKLSDKGLNEMISDSTPQDIKFVALDFQIDKTYKKNCYESIKDKLKGKCFVFTVNDIIYDNPLLNYPDLLKLAVEKFGLHHALDMSSGLSYELVSEAIEHGSTELVLAGCISLNQADAP
jgi:tetratricopeptide (TPR) repeat protein